MVQWKSNFFGSSWAHYELAKPGSLHLVPHLDRQAVLRRDYQAMRDMYLLEPLSFEQILTALSELEDKINHPESKKG